MTKVLYAIAYERFGNPNVEYLHASNQAAARFAFWNSLPSKRGIYIVGIAPALGVFVDEQEDKIKIWV